MRGPDAFQLAALELRLCDLAHPDWMADAALIAPDENASSAQGERHRQVPSAAVSRWLIDRHELAMLTPESFTCGWSYAVLGGHHATQALCEQTVSYLAAGWVRRAVAGVQARALHACLGASAYEELLHRVEPLDAWRVPRALPENPLHFLQAQAQRCLAALWQRDAPALAAWARVMSPAPRDLDIDLDAIADDRAPSRALIDELDLRLRADFAIELDGAEVE